MSSRTSLAILSGCLLLNVGLGYAEQHTLADDRHALAIVLLFAGVAWYPLWLAQQALFRRRHAAGLTSVSWRALVLRAALIVGLPMLGAHTLPPIWGSLTGLTLAWAGATALDAYRLRRP